jgi:hypothetical protein
MIIAELLYLYLNLGTEMYKSSLLAKRFPIGREEECGISVESPKSKASILSLSMCPSVSHVSKQLQAVPATFMCRYYPGSRELVCLCSSMDGHGTVIRRVTSGSVRDMNQL